MADRAPILENPSRSPEALAELNRIQERAIGECLEALHHDKRVLLEAPTGAGKTRMSSQVIDRFAREFERTHGRKPYVLALQHSQDLARQTSSRFAQNAPGCALRIGTSMDGVIDQNCDVNYAVVDTIANNLDQLRIPDLVLIDEAHHAIADKAQARGDAIQADYPKVLDHILSKNPNCAFMSQTATPGRPDNAALHPVISTAPSATIGYLELERAGQILIPDTVIGKIGMRPYESIGRSDPGYRQDLERFVAGAMASVKGDKERLGKIIEDNRPGAGQREGYREFVEESFSQWERHFRDKFPQDKLPGTVVFESNIDKARMFYEHAKAEGVKVALVHSAAARENDPDSFENATKAVDAYSAGRYDMLVSVKKLDEGIDAPRTRCVLLNRRTTSSIEYHQMAGRAMRMGHIPELYDVRPLLIDNGASTQIHGTIRDRAVVIDYVQSVERGIAQDRARPVEKAAVNEPGKPLEPDTFSLWKKVKDDPAIYGISDGSNTYYAFATGPDDGKPGAGNAKFSLRQVETTMVGKKLNVTSKPVTIISDKTGKSKILMTAEDIARFERDLVQHNKLAIQQAEARRDFSGAPTKAEADLGEERRVEYMAHFARMQRSMSR